MSGAPRLMLGPALLIALLAATAAEIAFYPQLASWLYATATGYGWDGSGLRYFQLFYVLPLALGGMAILAGVLLWRSSRDRPFGLRAVAIAWAVELIALVLSVAWYATATGRAASLGG